MNNKQAKKVVAVTLTVAILIGGTFAWQSFSQKVINETAGVDGNVGARLHNDFNGTDADVYVENYADVGGNDIYTRARVHEYMEYGTGSGILSEDDRPTEGIFPLRGDKAVSDQEPVIDYPETWDIYLYDEDSQIEADIHIDSFVNVRHGSENNANKGAKIYMPTFNKNFDDLTADIKGGLMDGGDRYDGVGNYSEYASYDDQETLGGDATYSPMSDAAINYGSTTINEVHTAKSTLEGSVISMGQWIDDGYNPGNFWVYDVDGWAYWANGVAPETATALLVDRVSVIKPPTVDWYYGLHVEMEAATAGDWGDQTSSEELEQGMYADITSDGIFLLNTIAEISPLETIGMSMMELGEGIEAYAADVVTIDGVAFYVLDKTTITGVDEEGYSTGRTHAALLLAVESIGEYPYNTLGGIAWSESEIRNTVLEEWLASQSSLSEMAVRVPVVTDGYYSSHEEIVSTEAVDEVTYDRVFLLSQMEILSTYGLNGAYMAQSLSEQNSWLRTPSAEDMLRQLNPETGLINEVGELTTAVAGVRPALWVAY